ncbi:hypothetical protein VB264_22765 [Arcicella aquatica]|uniref:Phage tail protein n=1 Tax=Arcicella aquatica TaxID=217141 RepID=A0ABU5QU63_9BACT|nr:hypothetical protein [Arcicella aquatica]MEA5260638.1 hypothetical protein [Arcicella aquatica]
MATVTYGLKSIKYGDIANDGGTATAFVSKGLTLSDTFKIETGDNEVQEFMSEENDYPEESIITMGKKQYKYTVMNADADIAGFLLGGTVAAGVWSSPDTTSKIQKSVQIETKTGHIITINRALVSAKRAGEFSKKALATIEVTLTVMKPQKAGVYAETWEDPS